MFSDPATLFECEDKQDLVLQLEDPESAVSIWIEGIEADKDETNVQKRVQLWRKLPTEVGDEVTLGYAIETGSPFTFNGGDKAFSKYDFCESLLQKLNDTLCTESVVDDVFVSRAKYWLAEYQSAPEYQEKGLYETLFLDNVLTDSRYHVLLSTYFLQERRNSSLNTITPFVDSAYNKNILDAQLYMKYKLYLIRDIEKILFGKSISKPDLSYLWQTELIGNMDVWIPYLRQLGKQVIAKIMLFISWEEGLKKLQELTVPAKGDMMKTLDFLSKMLKILKDKYYTHSARMGWAPINVTNIHYGNALQIFTQEVVIDDIDTYGQDFDEFIDQQQHLTNLFPDRLFCLPIY